MISGGFILENELIIEEIFPVEKFDFSKLNEENSVVFTGSPLQHPYEDEKFILILDPLSEHTQFIEFSKVDLVYVEELPSIISKKGENIMYSKIWIKNGALALKVDPFIVGKTRDFMNKKIGIKYKK
jgi:hypothetical protein